MPELLVMDRITKRYGQETTIFEALSYTFEPGTATGLVGPNGSGKTTLLRVLSVLTYPTDGTVTYGDLDIHEHPYQYLQHVGIVHAEPELPDYLSAVELLEWVMRARSRWDAQAEERIAQLLDIVQLDEQRQNLIGTYSSGMTQKTQIAAALAAGPDVLLMDEPFRGLDEDATSAVVEQLQSFKEMGGLLIISSHLKEPLRAVCGTFMEMAQQAPVV